MEEILNLLINEKDDKYKDFNFRIVHTVPYERMLGVRTPAIKKLAKKLRSTHLEEEFIKELPHYYHEENNLHAALIVQNKNIDEVFAMLEEFLPFIDNWATCDMLTPKVFSEYPDAVHEKCTEWLKSNRTYTVRFAIVTLLNFFLDENFDPADLAMLAELRSDEYYINMALAWYFSFALIKQYDAAVKLLTERKLSDFVHNKTIQKAVESFRIPQEKKIYLKSLRIKNGK